MHISILFGRQHLNIQFSFKNVLRADSNQQQWNPKIASLSYNLYSIIIIMQCDDEVLKCFQYYSTFMIFIQPRYANEGYKRLHVTANEI